MALMPIISKSKFLIFSVTSVQRRFSACISHVWTICPTCLKTAAIYPIPNGKLTSRSPSCFCLICFFSPPRFSCKGCISSTFITHTSLFTLFPLILLQHLLQSPIYHCLHLQTYHHQRYHH